MKSTTLILKTYLTVESILENKWIQHGLFLLFILLMFAPLFASVEDESMKEGVQDLQSDLFGNGWCLVGKIAAFATGCVFAVAQMSGLPFAGGIGVAAGIHFAQKYTAGAAGCLF